MFRIGEEKMVEKSGHKKIREVVLYLIFGFLSFMLNLVIFRILTFSIYMNSLLANIISWIAGTIFSFISNKLWVFNKKSQNNRESIEELITFTFSRVVTLAIEELLIYIFIVKMRFPSMYIKTAAQIVVIVLNYIFSKVWVFASGNK